LEQSDDVLVQQALAGALEPFNQLMLKYERLVCKVAMNYVRNKDNALDVTQNVFFKVYKKLDHVTEPGMFKPWLLRITYNESINWLRKNRRDEEMEDLEERAMTLGGPAEQEARVLKSEDQSLVLEGLKALNPKYKLAVALRYAEGMRIKEIADVMDCSEGMVKSLLFRGVRKLRNAVADSA